MPTRNVADLRWLLSDEAVAAVQADAGVGGVTITSPLNSLSVAGTSTAPQLDVIPANLTGIPQAGVAGLVTALAGKVVGISAGDSTMTIGGTATSPTVAVAPANLTGIPQAGVTGLTTALTARQTTTSGNVWSTAGWGVTVPLTTSASAAATGDAYLMAIRPARAFTLTKLTWATGSVALTGNYDIGLYTATGTRLWSKGATTAPSASTVTTETVTSQALTADTTYYVALSFPDATGTFRTMANGGVGGLPRGIDGTVQWLRFVTTNPLPSTLTIGSGVSAAIAPVVFMSEA